MSYTAMCQGYWGGQQHRVAPRQSGPFASAFLIPTADFPHSLSASERAAGLRLIRSPAASSPVRVAKTGDNVGPRT